jgi:hypothetical protein
MARTILHQEKTPDAKAARPEKASEEVDSDQAEVRPESDRNGYCAELQSIATSGVADFQF